MHIRQGKWFSRLLGIAVLGLDLPSAAQTGYASRAAPDPSDSFPPDFQGTVVYRGFYRGSVLTANRGAVPNNISGILQALGGRTTPISGDYIVTLELEGANLHGSLRTSGPLNGVGLNGTRDGTTCHILSTDGSETTAYCGRRNYRERVNVLNPNGQRIVYEAQGTIAAAGTATDVRYDRTKDNIATIVPHLQSKVAPRPTGVFLGKMTYSGPYSYDNSKGTINIQLVFDWPNVTGTYNSTGGYGQGVLRGSITKGTCHFATAHDFIIEGPCNAKAFKGRIVAGSSYLRSDPGTFDAAIVQIVDYSRDGFPATESATARAAEIERSGASLTIGGAAVSPTPSEAASNLKLITSVIAADADSWRTNRLVSGSVKAVEYYRFSDPMQTSVIKATYRYVNGLGEDSSGWAELQIQDNKISCIHYWDRKSCSTPQRSTGAVLAAMRADDRHIGPIKTQKACFQRWTKTIAEEHPSVPMGFNRDGNLIESPERPTTYRQVQGERYICDIPIVYAIRCLSEGFAERLVGGNRAGDDRTITKGVEARYADIENYNRRIAAGTCVRTK